MHNEIDLHIIDNKLINTINTSSQILYELDKQTKKINEMNLKLYDIKKSINISKSIYKSISSWLYRLDYFDLYNKYLNYTTETPEIIDKEINIYQDDITNTKNIDDNIINKIHVLKNQSLEINNILTLQNENLENLTLKNNIENINL
jgi:hypothetical protein